MQVQVRYAGTSRFTALERPADAAVITDDRGEPIAVFGRSSEGVWFMDCGDPQFDSVLRYVGYPTQQKGQADDSVRTAHPNPAGLSGS